MVSTKVAPVSIPIQDMSEVVHNSSHEPEIEMRNLEHCQMSFGKSN